jgi:GNAT superfamily N-acetyltransferase
MKIDELQYDEISLLAIVYLKAFDDNEAYRYIFPSSNNESIKKLNDDGLLWLFQRRLTILLSHGALILVIKDDDGIIIGGVGSILISQKPGLCGMLQHGLLLWPIYWGYDSLSRALELDDAIVNKQDETSCDAKIFMMAILPSHQGKGLGQSLFNALLQHIDNKWQCKCIGLDTQRITNTNFYSKFDFVITSDKNVCGFRSWTMIRRKG